MLDSFGLDASVLFPNYGLLWEQRLASDRAAQRANARAYNRFVAGICADGEGRLFGVAHVLLHDPEWAVEEIGRARADGVRLAMIAPAPVDDKPLSHPDFDPVWAAFSDHGVAPVFHVSEFESPLHPAWRQGEPEEGERLFDSIFLYLAPAVALADLILNGVLERFPSLRVGVVELTASWVPHFLLHIDGASDFYAQRHGEPYHQLAARPSEYFLRQVRVAALPYEMPYRLVPKVGDDTFMIGSDWPHAEGVADPVAAAERGVRGLEGAARENILGANAAWLLGL
jgi:predicted TIM-barrel fold metal-dependent hydrolase